MACYWLIDCLLAGKNSLSHFYLIKQYTECHLIF